jgi:hypothetical protein
MKKILFILFGLAAFCLILPSCKSKTVPTEGMPSTTSVTQPATKTSIIDFSKLQTIHSSAALFKETRGYVFDSIEVYVFDEDNIGYYMKPIKVLFYVDERKEIRFDCHIPMIVGPLSISLPIRNVGIFTGKFTSKELGITVGGENQGVIVNLATIFVFDSAKDAAEFVETLKKWNAELPRKPELPKIKGTDI